MSRARPKRTSTPKSDDSGPLSRLTERERVVLALMAEGRSNKEIAHALFISYNTTKAHISRIFHKLNVENRTEAAVLWTLAHQHRSAEQPPNMQEPEHQDAG